MVQGQCHLSCSPGSGRADLSTAIVAPMTTKGRSYPTRVDCHFQGKDGQIVLDQVRTVDKTRLVTRLGKIDAQTQREVHQVLSQLFAP